MNKDQREKDIQNYMKSLNLTRQEAEELWDCDNSDTVLPEVKEMEKKVKTMKRRYEGDKTAERKTTKREVKVDSEKVEIIKTLAEILVADKIEIVNSQREIAFSIGENNYSITLTKHRSK